MANTIKNGSSHSRKKSRLADSRSFEVGLVERIMERASFVLLVLAYRLMYLHHRKRER